jgi:7-cyano-7-deazaguanine synthase
MPLSPHTVVVLLSGGLDSSLVLASLVRDGHRVLKALTFDYGQVAAPREREAAEAMARHYHVPIQHIQLDWMEALLPGKLNRHAPAQNYAQLSPGHEASMTNPDWMAAHNVWVPNRNGVLLNIAAAVAEAIGANAIAFGANADEAQGFPDNTAEYRDALTQALWYSTQNHVQILTPMVTTTKAEMVKLALDWDVPLQHVWSCYGTQAIQCGQCPSCLRLKDALKQARPGQGALDASRCPPEIPLGFAVP